ncbi:hypothetical protein ABPG72_020077 [Tetrahymena utriculariae]
MQKQKQTQEVKSCLRTYSSLQGQVCTYWNKATCNKSTCKYLHTSVACIQPLKITQSQEITIIISKQITLSPQEAGDYIANNYKNSNKGITVILNKSKAPVDLKKIVRGNATDKKKQAQEISKFLEKLKSLNTKQNQQDKKKQKTKSVSEEQNEIQKILKLEQRGKLNFSISPQSHKCVLNQINNKLE